MLSPQRKQDEITFLSLLLASGGVAGTASRHPVFTAAQVGGLLDDDTEFIFSGSDDDFDFSADDYDPLEREQGNHDHNS